MASVEVPSAGRVTVRAALAGCDPAAAAHAREALAALGVPVMVEFDSLEPLLAPGDPEMPGVRTLIVTSPRQASQFEAMKRVVQARPECPVLALVDSAEPMLFLKAMRLGAAQVIPMPLSLGDLADAIASVMEQPGVVQGGRKEVITVAGATGGAGASTIAVNLAYNLAEVHQRRCVLIDLALKVGALADLLDVLPDVSILDLLQDVQRLDPVLVGKALVPITERLGLLAGPQGLIGPRSVPLEHLFPIIETVLTLTDLVVIDLPASFDDVFFETLLSSQHVILVAQQKIPAIRALKLITESLEREKAECITHLVLNRYNKRIPGFTAEDVQRLLRSERVLTVAEDSASVIHATNKGQPLRKAAPSSAALADVEQLIKSVMRLDGAEGGRPTPPGLLGRWLRGLR